MMTTGLKTQQTVSSVAEYQNHHEYMARLNAEATGWDDYPEDLKTSAMAAWELVESGQTAWHLPFFHSDIRFKVNSIYKYKSLEFARIIARWLLETLPDDPIDPETRPFLESIRDGSQIPRSYASWCRWPQKSEFYRCHLNWQMVGFAEDAEADRRAEENTHWFMLKTGRGEEYVERQLHILHTTGENILGEDTEV
ncbi:MAG: hypothetical protein SWY16_27320 [Cyanobacteriota bacterium]|nr:hypothetical protein [Cyanobacteriota bacterium]